MNFLEAQRKLAILWFCGSGISFVILIIQSCTGYYGEKVSDAWSWFLPYVLPTLTLMLGTVIADKKQSRSTVDSFAFWASVGLSVFYLFALVVGLIAGNLTPFGPLQLMKISIYWLGPCQTLTGIALGVFFVKRAGTT